MIHVRNGNYNTNQFSSILQYIMFRYHGKCVNVTKAMGQLMEQEGREWICVYCKDPSLKRPKAAARRIRKASRASNDSSGSTKKSEQAQNSALACIVCSKPSRKNSIYCSEACILKHAQGVERVNTFMYIINALADVVNSKIRIRKYFRYVSKYVVIF